MKSFFVFILLLISITSFSQGGYAVRYQRGQIYLPFKINGVTQRFDLPDNLLLFSDSLSLYQHVVYGNPIKKKRVFGEKLIHHAILYNKNSDSIYNEVNWPTKKDKYLIGSKMVKSNWIFLEGEKQILSYKCKPAILISPLNDTTLVWFTPEIPEPYGPLIYFGLPGLVLEVLSQRNKFNLIAIKVVKDNFSVLFPTEGKIVSNMEYWEIKSKK